MGVRPQSADSLLIPLLVCCFQTPKVLKKVVMQELFGELKLKEHLFRDAPKMLPENKK
jgi:hypothetical protein